MDFTAFLKIPEVLDDKRIWQLRADLAGMFMNMVKVYRVDGIGKPLDDYAEGPRIYSADGTHQVFYGNPTGSFDIESRIAEVFPGSIVSNGKVFPTGEETWVVRTNPQIAAIRETPSKDINTDIMAAMASVEMAMLTGNRISYSAKSRERAPGLRELVAEAAEHGITNAGMFYHCGGVPFMSEGHYPGMRVSLVKGTEVLVEGFIHPGLKRLESMYPGLRIHPAIPIDDAA